MKKVSILAPEGSASIAIIGPMDVLYKSSVLWEIANNGDPSRPFFVPEIVSLHKSPAKAMNDYPLNCHKKIDDVDRTDLIIIPSLDRDIQEMLTENQGFVHWIKKQHSMGAEVASFCTGAFLFAATGLLDGKAATTHWHFADMFREMYPKVLLQPDKIMVDQNGLYSCGGAFTFLNLLLYLIEKYRGHEIAVFTSKILLIDMDRTNQSNYTIFNTQKHHQDDAILQAQEFIEENFRQKLSVDGIARSTSLSSRTFIRRFKEATGNTPLQYIQRVRVEAVKHALESGNESIQEIVYSSGYEESREFQKTF